MFIQENFNNAPSCDLGSDCLYVFVELMLGQARECLFEKSVLGLKAENDLDLCLELGQEAAHVSASYDKVLQTTADSAVKECMPYFWLSLLQGKREHYRALSDYYVALGLSNHLAELTERSVETFQFLHDIQQVEECERPAVPTTEEQRKYLGKI